ncbi:MAG: class I SAM-dependent methyltransferase [Promethearchaeota archaeon]
MVYIMDFDEAITLLGDHFRDYVDDIKTTIESLNLSPLAKIIDVGTGRGKMAIILALMDYTVFTGEPDGDNWADWENPAKKVNVKDRIVFRPFSAEKIPAPDNKFDLLTALGTYHHIDQKEKSLKEFLRVIKSGGRAVIFEFSEQGIDRIKQKYPGHPDAVNPIDYYDGDPTKVFTHQLGDLNVYIFSKE